MGTDYFHGFSLARAFFPRCERPHTQKLFPLCALNGTCSTQLLVSRCYDATPCVLERSQFLFPPPIARPPPLHTVCPIRPPDIHHEAGFAAMEKVLYPRPSTDGQERAGSTRSFDDCPVSRSSFLYSGRDSLRSAVILARRPARSLATFV